MDTAADIRSLLQDSVLNGDDPETLRKHILAGFESELVKQNPKRKIYRLKSLSGREFYLKSFAGQSLFSRLFRFYPLLEYRAARSLEEMGLPVIHYAAWGVSRHGGFCISNGIPEAVSARQYCFETLVREPASRPLFLELLSDVTRALRRCRIAHPDYHLGNILWSMREKRLYLVDPWGIHKVFFPRRLHAVQLCLPWLELSGMVPEEELLQGVQKSGLTATLSAARDLLALAAGQYEKRRDRQWKKLSDRILSGRSKFATGVVLPEGKCMFRHTEWFAPPEKLELNPAWCRVELEDASKAREIWLHSFLRMPPEKNPPAAWLMHENGKSSLFYAEPKKTQDIFCCK